MTKRGARLLAPLLLLVAGCAGVASKYVPNPANEVFALSASARAINTNGQVQIKALSASGGATVVRWRIVRGENDQAIGQGSIDSRGVYTPPSSLTRDAISVEVQAQLRGDPARTATEVIQVTPGFLQPLTPENASLVSGGSLLVTAQLAEVGGGSVAWQLGSGASGGKALGVAYGTLSQESCQRSLRDYTVCTAVYTAPPEAPARAGEVYVVASVGGGASGSRQSAHILLGNAGIASSPLTNQAVQTSMVQLGSSGGNNNDADTAKDGAGRSYVSDCCGGTLGALLRDESGSQYILSNNHVLAESDQAGIGDNIVQPGLIDRNCDQNAGRPVATLRYFVPLATTQTNVDAAIAEVNAGTVDPGGAILQLGAPGGGANGGIGAAAPAAGGGEAITPALLSPEAAPLRVAKSGRTTGLTCSSIDAVDLSIQVDYYKDCAETQRYYRKTYTGQIGIGGDGFSDSGDSGSLVVNAANAQPLGLYFAGGTDDRGGGFSVASPIQDVLAALGNESGRRFSVVGGGEHPVSCLNYDARGSGAPVLTEVMRKKAEAVIRRNGALVSPGAGILGLAAGASADSPGTAAVLVYVDRLRQSVPVPQILGGLRTIVVATDESSLASGTAPTGNRVSGGIRLTESVLREARLVQQASARRLMADPAIFGVGVTQSRDNPAEAALLVLVDMARTPRSTPPILGGLRTRYLALNRFHVTRSKHAGAPHPSSCELRSTAVSQTGEFNPDKPALLPLP